MRRSIEKRGLPGLQRWRNGGPPTSVGGEPGGFLPKEGNYPTVISKRGKEFEITGDFAE